ncbi:RNA polymerase sigma factor [Emticicia agri]|uniref:Sigma-70 family RNA polymerase sigma factor n=1 Tax=Emticicia agri TaxID=2492393 RepID=A0A4Q5LWX6_9BACT|nr:sigma-70 family RNA polymerase sigma factor [Emticicia agri]RYU94222.1 sigma-70 family RNA polymerase sigma factor [Emticicia agri]
MDKKETFIRAIKDNERLIVKIASVYTNTADDKADLIQEIIYQLWKSFDSFNQQSGLSTWLYRVALNVAIYQLKIAKRRVITVEIDEQILNYANEDHSAIEQKWELFRQQIESLNLLDKAIVMLYLDQKSHEEIAEIVGISVSNVGTKIQRIKEKLKKQHVNAQNHGIR